MLDHRQGVARNHVSSFNPAYQMHRSYNSTGDTKLDFWGARKSKTRSDGNLSCSVGSDIEFQVQKPTEKGFGTYSPPLWKANKSRNTIYESSPLLPHNHHYSNISPTTRTQVIEERRKELMEMIQNMPESTYELSLKDIVDEHHMHIQEEVKQELVVDETSFHFEAEAQIKKQKKNKKKNIKSSKISRSASMDKENFLLKMFFPILGSKRQAATRNSSKVSPRPSFEGSENRIDKGWSIRRILVAGQSKNSGKSSGNNRTARHADGNVVPGCWPFFQSKKSKWKRQRGCIF